MGYRWLLERLLDGMKVFDPERVFTVDFAYNNTCLLVLQYTSRGIPMQLSHTGPIKPAVEAMNRVLLDLRQQS